MLVHELGHHTSGAAGAGSPAAVAVTPVETPLLDGLVGRAIKHAARRYAVCVGAGPDLARALQVLAAPFDSRRGVPDRLADRHPNVAGRLAQLDGQATALPGRGGLASSPGPAPLRLRARL